MRAGILLIVLYWALFTIRAGLQPKVAAEALKSWNTPAACNVGPWQSGPCVSAAGLKTSCWAWLSCGLLSCWAQF